MDKVAVILPVSDSFPHLKPMIESLYNSTNFPFKLIIIESESKDGTRQYVDKLFEEKDNVEVYHTKKKGLTHAINFGIKKAGKLDVYLTQDDVIHFKLYGRDWLLEMYESSKNKKVGIVTNLGGYGISGPEYVKNMKWVGTWSTYIPRTTIKKIGLYDEKMSPGDDIDYCYRMSKAKLNMAVIDYWTQHHRITEHGKNDTELKQKRMSKYFRKKHKL